MSVRQRGFTLIEVIVAFALLAASLTLLLASLSGASSQVRQADHQGRAALHAQSLLAGVGIETPLVVGEQRGQWEEGKYRWVLDTTAYLEPQRGAEPAAAPDLLQLELQVSWGEQANEHLRWSTLRLAPTQAQTVSQ